MQVVTGGISHGLFGDVFLTFSETFDDMPANEVSAKMEIKVRTQDKHSVKTVTRTCKLADGSTKVLKKTIERDFEV